MLNWSGMGIVLTGGTADDATLAFASALADRCGTQRVRCIRVRGDEAEASGGDDAQALEQQTREVLPENLRDRAQITVELGDGVSHVLRIARDEQLDVMLCGRRLPAHPLDIGSLVSRLARKAPCTVLAVPPYCYPHFSRLLVPVDFSDHSKLALLTALDLARCSGQPNAQVLVQTIFTVGYGYRYAGVTFHEAARNIEQATCKKLDEFLKDVDASGVQFERVCTCSDRTAEAVHDLAAARKMDIIVVGSRGASRAAAAILGSTAERILHSAPLPVLIVKKKGETVSLLNVLLGS